MARRRFTAEEVIQNLRTVEIEQGRGATLEEAARKVGITAQTLVRWRKEYGATRKREGCDGAAAGFGASGMQNFGSASRDAALRGVGGS